MCRATGLCVSKTATGIGLRSLLACLCLLVAQLAAAQNTLFDLADFRVQDELPAGTATALKAEWLRPEDGGVRCSLEGAVAGRRRWLIPVTRDLRVDCDVAFHVKSENIDTLPGKSNLRVLLRRRPVRAGDPNRAAIEALPAVVEIPLYTAAAARHEEAGRVAFSTRDGRYEFVGFIVELILRDDAPATFDLRKLSVSFHSNLPTDEELAATLAEPPTVRAEVVRSAEGRLAIQVNGERLPPIGYFHGCHAPSAAPAKLATVAGMRLQRIALNFGGPNPYFREADSLWPAPDYVDFPTVDQRIRRALPTPESLVMLDVILTHPPTWWPELPAGAYPYLSDLDPAVREWRRRTLRLLLAHVRQADYANRVIGVNLILGMGMNHMPPPNRERHPAYVKAFRTWLAAHYKDDAQLCTAWQVTTMTLADAQPLEPGRWPYGAIQSLRHPGHNRWGLDSYRFYNESWSASLLDLAATVKTISGHRYIVGISGGPALALNDTWNNSFSQAPWAVAHLLASPQVDIIEVPAGDLDRRPGLGTAGEAFVLADSARNRNKMLWIRQDFAPLPAWTVPTTPASRVRDRLEAQRRVFAVALHHDAGIWLWQGAPDNYDDVQLIGEVKRQIEVSGRFYGLPRAPHADVAFVVDPNVAAWRGPDDQGPLLTPAGMHEHIRAGRDPEVASQQAARAWYLEAHSRRTWPVSGLYYDVVSLSDLQPGRYRMLVMAHTLYLTDVERQRLQAARISGRAIVWSWADAIAATDFITPSLASETSGIRIGLQNDVGRFDFAGAAGLETLIGRQRLEGYLGWQGAFREPERSLQVQFGPQFFVKDEDAKPIAMWRDTDRVAIAMKVHGDSTSYYSASPVLNPELLRAIALDAGAHVYTTNNAWCLVDRHFIAIHPRRDGVMRLTLRYEEPLYDVFREQAVPPRIEHLLDLKAARTYIFFRGTKADWDAK